MPPLSCLKLCITVAPLPLSDPIFLDVSVSCLPGRTKLPGPRFKSVAVQTEGKVALYPPGSRWLGEGDSQARYQQDSNREEGAGARSGRLVPPAAGSSGLGYEAGARRSSSGRPAGRSASRERDRVQIDAQSLPTTLTLWGESDSIGTGRSGNRSVQSTSRVTDKAAAATATAAAAGTPSRRGRSARRQIQMQLQQQQQAAKLQQLKRAGPVVAARIGARLPQLKVHLTHSQSQSRPQPEAGEHTLSLQSVSGGGGGEGGGQDSPSFTSRSRSSKPAPPPPSLSQAAFVRPAASRPSPGASPAPTMKVHGLGFVSPLQLPQV